MTKTKVDELMALADKYARCNATTTAFCAADAREFLRTALDAAMNHGVPDNECPMCNHHQSSISYDCNNCGRSVQIEHTAAPQAQTQNGLFVDLIAQHPGLAEELKAIDEAPMPTWTPPRLTDEDMDALWRSVDYKVAYDKFRLDLARTIETAVRFQFGIND